MHRVTRREIIAMSVAAGTASAAASAGQEKPANAEAPAAATAPRDWWDKEFRMLVTLGESTTAGGWASYRERCWANQLARLINEFQRVPVQLVNVGIGGNVISPRSPAYEHSGKPAALERLQPHVLRHQPDLLIVSYGLNDARGGTPIDLFRAELQSLIEQVRQQIQPLIVLLGPYFMTGFDMYGPHWNRASLDVFYKFNRAIADVAAATKCLYVDLLATYGNAPWLVHHDGVHANDLGHRLVANQIFAVLAAHCSGLAKETRELEKHIPRWRDESVLQQAAKRV
jgi:lysophospholipase L1-like esterase